MATKILVTAIGQQIIAEVKQIENKETSEVVGYWLSNPRVVIYNRTEEGDITVGFTSYCLISDEQEFSLKADHVVAILEARDDVVAKYSEIVAPPAAPEADVTPEEPATQNDEPNSPDPVAVGSPADLLD